MARATHHSRRIAPTKASGASANTVIGHSTATATMGTATIAASTPATQRRQRCFLRATAATSSRVRGGRAPVIVSNGKCPFWASRVNRLGEACVETQSQSEIMRYPSATRENRPGSEVGPTKSAVAQTSAHIRQGPTTVTDPIRSTKVPATES